jgi:hypothetical protein
VALLILMIIRSMFRQSDTASNEIAIQTSKNDIAQNNPTNDKSDS